MKKNLILSSILACFSLLTFAQNKTEEAVAKAVDAWRTAVINVDRTGLENIMSDKLSYGHSGGKLETKAELIEALMSGNSKFVTMDLTDQKVMIIDKKTAMVRHKLTAQTKDKGVDNNVKLHVFTVWTKENGLWKMVGRQAIKLT